MDLSIRYIFKTHRSIKILICLVILLLFAASAAFVFNRPDTSKDSLAAFVNGKVTNIEAPPLARVVVKIKDTQSDMARVNTPITNY